MPGEWISLSQLMTPALENNLAYLNVIDAALHRTIQNAVKSEELLFQNQDGLIRCRIQVEPEQWIFGGTSPQRELEAIRREIMSIPADTTLLILAGNACGYVLAQTLSSLASHPERNILVIEPTAARLRACFAAMDLRAWLAKGRLHFIVSEINVEGILRAVERFNLWGAKRRVLYRSPETQLDCTLDEFNEQYEKRSTEHQTYRVKALSQLNQRETNRTNVKRALLIDCWPGAPGGLHIQAIQRAFEARSVQTRLFPLNRYQIDSYEKEYRRRIELSLLSLLDSFAPDLLISYGYHAPRILGEAIYEALRIPCLQVVSNIAYYDTKYYAEEYTALIERNLIHIFKKRGAPHPFFVPIMADICANSPAPTDRRVPIVFVGNSLGLTPAAVEAFFNQWKGRDALLQYFKKAEQDLSDFDRRENLYNYIHNNPIPQIQTGQEEYEVFRYLLCQGSAARRRTLLESIAPMGLALFGGDWDGYLAPNAPLRRCWRGPLPLHEESKTFAHGALFINIHSVGHVTGPNMRFFNAAGMGGLQITDGKFSNYLQPESEAVYYQSRNELMEKIQYYLHHPNECDEIRARGQERVRNEWTYNHWMNWISKEMKLNFV